MDLVEGFIYLTSVSVWIELYEIFAPERIEYYNPNKSIFFVEVNQIKPLYCSFYL